ncbi:ABC transporter permease, partial [Klebsiella pneumoniae]|nr:ABC transporter permease [Klebsiella pneumoniae]
VSLIFLYLIGYQLLTLWKHPRMKIWIDLYPVGGEEKKKDFLTLLNAILITGSVIFTIIFLLATKDFMMTGILLVVS